MICSRIFTFEELVDWRTTIALNKGDCHYAVGATLVGTT